MLGGEHPQTLGVLCNLAASYGSQRRYEEAERLFRRALEGARKALGPDHPHPQLFAPNHAACLAAMRVSKPRSLWKSITGVFRGRPNG